MMNLEEIEKILAEHKEELHRKYEIKKIISMDFDEFKNDDKTVSAIVRT